MKNKKLPKIHLACANDQLRPIMNYILVTKEDIVASDAHVLVVHKTEQILGKEFAAALSVNILIHASIWKKIYNDANIIKFNDQLNQIIVNGISYPIELEDSIGKYPNYKAVIPDSSIIESIPAIGINPYFLHKTAEALFSNEDDKAVKMIFSGDSRAIRIIPKNHENKGRAIIMPVMIAD